MTPLLSVEGLTVRLRTPRGLVKVVDEIDYSVQSNEVFGLAGESGSGKTVSAMAITGLLPRDAIIEGRVVFDGRDLALAPRRELQSVRGRDIAMVFQDPKTALHPQLSIETQMTEHLRKHLGMTRRSARRRAMTLLSDVQIPDPERALRSFHHQFSGGMSQRIAIAIALACEPRLIIADEPTTALDVTVQAAIMRLFDSLRRRGDLSIVLITHDLGVLSSIADRITVLYAGRVVESGPTRAILRSPHHPYTEALLAALLHKGTLESGFDPLPGAPPTPGRWPSGCRFHPRCRYSQESCSVVDPRLVEIERGHNLACPIDPVVNARGRS